MRLAVCIATCRRPAGLGRLLRALADVAVPDHVDVAIVVVDNDAARSAQSAVERARERLPWPAHYVVEARPGVSFARNAALDATAGYDAIAFIDDDEVPGRAWLEELVACRRATGAAAVCGPTKPVFETGVPAWLRSAFRLCYATPRPAGRLSEISTGNALLDRGVLERRGLRFDESLALVGGEDTMLGWDLVQCGETIAWSEGAVVEEYVPASRANLRWLLRRWYRTGNVEALLAMRRRRGALGRAYGLTGGLARVGIGTARLIPSLPRFALGAREPGVLRLYTVCRGLGMLAAVIGRRHEEYRVVHGA